MGAGRPGTLMELAEEKWGPDPRAASLGPDVLPGQKRELKEQDRARKEGAGDKYGWALVP